MCKPPLLAACLFAVTANTQVAPSTPPRLQSGAAPALPAPAAAVGGGQVFVELSIGPSGEITDITPLRTTPPFTELVERAVRRWRFRPATAGSALVAAQFRAPTLNTPTHGELPKDVASASDGTPFPIATDEPPYPPQAQSSGVVMIEALVGEVGTVTEARVIRSAPPFDSAALASARQWRFRPARSGGRAEAAFVYLIFGFPQPVVGTKRP